jgi:glutathione S-transferase
LSESADVLRFLDKLKGGPSLVPEDPETKRKVQSLLDLVHSSDVDTGILLLARNAEEMNAKKNSPWKVFVVNRQDKLEKERAAHPDHPFYGPKSAENGYLYNFYTTETGPAHESFYAMTQEAYRKFAGGMDKLEKLLVLPYAAGDALTEADFHVVPWLAHAMEGAGTEPSETQDFEPLEKMIQKSIPDFKVGPNTKKWWANMNETATFKKVYPVLH